MGSNLYFIQAEKGGPIKIGVSIDPKKRLAMIQTGNPDKLRIILLVNNINKLIEKFIHQELDRFRIRGEWFSEKLLDMKDTGELNRLFLSDYQYIIHYPRMPYYEKVYDNQIIWSMGNEHKTLYVKS